MQDLCAHAPLQEKRNGFTFDGADDGSLHGALDRAIRLFREDPATWRHISTRNMKVRVAYIVCAGKERTAL
jgi:glycogen synthase